MIFELIFVLMFLQLFYLLLCSKTEIILATNEDNKPKALINKPGISNAFNLNKIIIKYIKIAKLII